MTDTRSVTLTRTYPTSPERVWAAWTDTGLLTRWFGCRPDQLWTVHEWDVRVGGHLRVSMDFDGEPFVVTGAFLDVDPPERLVYTFGDGVTITVTIAVTITGSGAPDTTVTVTHDGLPTGEMVGIVTDGWTSSLTQLAHEFAARATEHLVMTYWRSWQGGDPDWPTMRSCMADEIDTEAGPVPADKIVTMVQGGNPWRDVELVDAVYSDDHAAILYRGVDTVTGDTMDVAEFLTIADGKVSRLRGIIPMG